MEHLLNLVKIRNAKLWTSVIFSMMIFGLLSYFTGITLKNVHFSVTFLICVSGFIGGWIIGVVTNAYDGDHRKVKNFTKVMGSFLLGYIISKYDEWIHSEINPSKILLNPYGSRFLLFSCFFGLTWFVIFIYRNHIKER